MLANIPSPYGNTRSASLSSTKSSRRRFHHSPINVSLSYYYQCAPVPTTSHVTPCCQFYIATFVPVPAGKLRIEGSSSINWSGAVSSVPCDLSRYKPGFLEAYYNAQGTFLMISAERTWGPNRPINMTALASRRGISFSDPVIRCLPRTPPVEVT